MVYIRWVFLSVDPFCFISGAYFLTLNPVSFDRCLFLNIKPCALWQMLVFPMKSCWAVWQLHFFLPVNPFFFWQVLVQRKEYIRNGWNSLCVAIISLGVLDIIVGFTLPAVFRGDHKSVTITVVIFMLFRIIRLFRLLEVSGQFTKILRIKLK